MSFMDKFLGHNLTPKEKAAAPYVEPLLRKDYAAALPLLKHALHHEDAHAMGLMGAMVALGLGVAKDPIDACNWFRQAAIRGDAPSQAALGIFLARGLGTNLNHRESAFWLYKAILAGNPQSLEVFRSLAQNNPKDVALGLCSAASLCNPRDHYEAANALFIAGQGGNGLAIEVLGALAYQDNAVVGTYFTEDELCRLVTSLKKIKRGKACSAVVPGSPTLH